MKRGWGLAFVLVAAACVKKDDEEPTPIYGAAAVTVDGAPMEVDTVTATWTRQCSGGFPGISDGDCSTFIAVEASGPEGSVSLRPLGENVPGEDRVVSVKSRTIGAVTSITMGQGPKGSVRFWNIPRDERTKPLERASTAVAADGRVTFVVTGPLEPATGNPATTDVRVEATVTIDCAPAGPDEALCKSASGTPRRGSEP